MGFKYKIDVLAALKDSGFSTYRIRKEKIFGESILQDFRTGKIVSFDVFDKLCKMLSLDIGDIIEHDKAPE